MYLVKICHLNWFNKMLLADTQAGSIGGTTRLGEFREKESLSLQSPARCRRSKMKMLYREKVPSHITTMWYKGLNRNSGAGRVKWSERWEGRV